MSRWPGSSRDRSSSARSAVSNGVGRPTRSSSPPAARSTSPGSVLAELGIDADERGVVVDDRGRTSVPSIYAAGDVVGRQLFTHAAAHQAAVAVRDAFYPGRGRADAVVPWATFTEPTLAHAGLTAAEARDRFGDRVRVHRWSLEHNDRAHTDGTSGHILLVERVRPVAVPVGGRTLLASGAAS